MQKTVVVHPERCVGCMQCMLACATAHSRSESLLAALHETPKPRSRIHLGAGWYAQGFPNRCRHCDPAPCLSACLPGAIFRESNTGTVLIDPNVCINCASCAMACPFGVLRYHVAATALPDKVVAVKCDNCIVRQRRGAVPACVESCKTGALTFDTLDADLRRQTDRVARSLAAESTEISAAGVNLLNTVKRAMHRVNHQPSKGGCHA